MKDILEAIIITLIFGIFIVIICALPTMLLWNWLMPAIFGLGKITFWQALGVNALAGILFRTKLSVNRED